MLVMVSRCNYGTNKVVVVILVVVSVCGVMWHYRYTVYKCAQSPLVFDLLVTRSYS